MARHQRAPRAATAPPNALVDAQDGELTDDAWLAASFLLFKHGLFAQAQKNLRVTFTRCLHMDAALRA
jgi:hypothetical protein